MKKTLQRCIKFNLPTIETVYVGGCLLKKDTTKGTRVAVEE